MLFLATIPLHTLILGALRLEPTCEHLHGLPPSHGRVRPPAAPPLVQVADADLLARGNAPHVRFAGLGSGVSPFLGFLGLDRVAADDRICMSLGPGYAGDVLDGCRLF
jgi:hypothetical protein